MVDSVIEPHGNDSGAAATHWGPSFNVTTWGWIHLLAGALLVVAGFCLFHGAVWARVAGVGVAIISAVLSFMWLPYCPICSMLIIALDVFIIWAH